MNQENDLTLLRPFDLEAAKRGDIVQWYDDSETLVYVGPATNDGSYCFKWLDGNNVGTYETYRKCQVCMAPLCWLEGKPVYKGDVLYDNDGPKTVASSCLPGWAVSECGITFPLSRCTWTKPVRKVKKEGWINLYKTTSTDISASTSHCYLSEELAKKVGSCTPDYIKTIHVEWEVEE